MPARSASSRSSVALQLPAPGDCSASELRRCLASGGAESLLHRCRFAWLRACARPATLPRHVVLAMLRMRRAPHTAAKLLGSEQTEGWLHSDICKVVAAWLMRELLRWPSAPAIAHQPRWFEYRTKPVNAHSHLRVRSKGVFKLWCMHCKHRKGGVVRLRLRGNHMYSIGILKSRSEPPQSAQ